jgi:hypothetical protein
LYVCIAASTPRLDDRPRRRRRRLDRDVELSRSALGTFDSTWPGAVLLARRLAHADADPEVVLGLEVLGDAAQAVVAGEAAAGLDLHDARFEVELVVDDDDVRRGRRCGSGARVPTRPDRTRSCT